MSARTFAPGELVRRCSCGHVVVARAGQLCPRCHQVFADPRPKLAELVAGLMAVVAQRAAARARVTRITPPPPWVPGTILPCPCCRRSAQLDAIAVAQAIMLQADGERVFDLAPWPAAPPPRRGQS